jgi:glycosyltransferase involved in cell wall biosynthesis
LEWHDTPVVVIDPALDFSYERRRKIQNFVLPRAKRVIVFGSNQLDYINQVYGTSVEARFLHHRIDTNFYKPKVRALSDKPTVITVGIDKQRDFATYVKCARENPQWNFLVKSNRRIVDVPSNLRVVSERLSMEALRDLYLSATICVVPVKPTIHANGVNGILEGMACGLPVIVTDNPQLRDYLEPDRNCLIYQPNDSHSMAAQIEKVVGSGSVQEDLIHYSRAWAHDKCGMRQYVKSLLLLCEIRTD